MRVFLVTATLLVVGLAGCSEESEEGGEEPTDDAFADFDYEVDDDHGVILGVVVDHAIMPVPDALVRVVGQDGLTATTDGEGRFVIEKVPAGSHILNASKLNFKPIQVSVAVEAAVDDPDIVKIRMESRFSQQPFMQDETFRGFITCGYDVNVASSLCLNDYTRFIPIIGDDGGIAPQLQETGLDDRDHDYAIGDGWQTHIVEMHWVPSSQSTSERMSAIVSHFPRPATHWYGQAGGEVPVLLRIEQGVQHEDTGGSEPSMIPPEGRDDMHFFAAVDTNPGEPIAVAVQQSFEVFFSTFYYGKPPEGWSLVAGDGNPFAE